MSATPRSTKTCSTARTVYGIVVPNSISKELIFVSFSLVSVPLLSSRARMMHTLVELMRRPKTMIPGTW